MTQQLDRRILIQNRTVVRDALGGEIVTWVDFATLWATVRRTGAREQYLSGSNREQASVNAVFRIRYRSDLDATMRVIHDGSPYDILGVEEVGRKRHLDITAQARF